MKLPTFVVTAESSPDATPAASIGSKQSRTRALLRRLSDIDLTGIRRAFDPRRTRSAPDLRGNALQAPQSDKPVDRIDAKVRAQLTVIVDHIHQGIRVVAETDPTMAPGLVIASKLSRHDEFVRFRRLFIEKPGHALSNVLYNATETRLPDSITHLMSNRLLARHERAFFFDALMTDPITANLVVLVSTQRSFLRIGLKMRRAMLMKVTAEGRHPLDVGTMTPIQTLQASGLLFKKERITPLQTIIDTILLGLGGEVPALIGTLVHELFVADKNRMKGFASTLAITLATQVHTLLRLNLPHNDVDKAGLIAQHTELFHTFIDAAWTRETLKGLLERYVGPNTSEPWLARLQREGERIESLGRRIAAAKAG